jgi:hypothetical protein
VHLRATTRRRRTGAAAIAAALACALAASPGVASPPFETDDAEPTEYGHFETYLFTSGSRAQPGMSGTALGFEITYGLLPDLEIGVEVPWDYERADDRGSRFGVTSAQVSLQYRFVHEDEDGWLPQISFAPAIVMPLGGAGHRMTDSETREFLPVWAQKAVGDWLVFGGGGYWINPGRDNRDFWFFGVAALRRVTDKLQLGIEVFHEGAEVRGETGGAGVNVGAVYELSEGLEMVGAIGRGVGQARAGNEFSYYLGLGWAP